jgi:hypothetical protein
MRHLGISQRRGRESSGSDSVDARAASIILQGFLERQKAPHRVLETNEDEPKANAVGEDLF